MELHERFRGALLGLAVGDALGAAVEFKEPGTFEPVTGMRGGGPFDLEPGYWTDDTSLALCMAESLIEKQRFDAVDQLNRYVRWYQEGHLSSTGAMFDIGTVTKRSLEKFLEVHTPYCGPTDPDTAGNGSLMRLCPVPMYFANNAAKALVLCGNSSRTTHAAPASVDACRYFGALLFGAFQEVDKEKLLSDHYCPKAGYWKQHPLMPDIDAIASGSYKGMEPPEVKSSGYVVDTLTAVLWAFNTTDNFKDGMLKAVNLGNDADTVGSVYGQLAGAYYGESAIPSEWLETLAHREMIEGYCDKLFELSRSVK